MKPESQSQNNDIDSTGELTQQTV